MVRMRAISRFVSFRRAGFSSAPVADWKRRLKSSLRESARRRSSSSSVMSLSSLALVKELSLPLHDLGLDRELVAGQPQRVARERLRDAGELEHHATGLDHRHPSLGRALARAHAGLGRLLRDRLVREDVDPDLAAALDLARHRDTSRLDLPVRDPAGLEGFEAVVAELDRRLALRLAAPAAAVDLAELRLLGEEHLALSLLASGRARAGAAARLLALVARLVELLRLLVHRLRSRRVGRVGDGRRRGLDLRLDLRLLAALGRLRLLVGPRPLHVVLPAGAIALTRTAATATRPAAAPAAPAHRSETLAVGTAAAAALARGTQALERRAPATARLVGVAP